MSKCVCVCVCVCVHIRIHIGMFIHARVGQARVAEECNTFCFVMPIFGAATRRVDTALHAPLAHVASRLQHLEHLQHAAV